MSVVVGGLTFTAAQQQFNQKEAKFEALAERACLDLGPPKAPLTFDEARAATTLLDLCNYAHGALIGRQP